MLAGAGGLPVHVFGLGHPEVVRWLFGLGVWSVDSSSYVRQAVGGRYWDVEAKKYIDLQDDLCKPSCPCTLCRDGLSRLSVGGLWGKQKLALHNLGGTKN